LSITNMKFILYCFEWLSRLKINYYKSEAFVFGTSEMDTTRVANMLNCQLGSLPMKYKGIPISDSKLSKVVFTNIPEKVSKRIPPWKGKWMSSRARLILINKCLSSLSTYTMGFYLPPLGTHRVLDGMRSKFFWRGAENDFKYHMIRWSAIYRPKEQGGLGIVNTRILNECLMVKWIWKLYSQEDSLWVRLKNAKYMRDPDFFKSREAQGSQFWKSLHKVKHLFK
jgi:hypothetical protein